MDLRTDVKKTRIWGGATLYVMRICVDCWRNLSAEQAADPQAFEREMQRFAAFKVNREAPQPKRNPNGSIAPEGRHHERYYKLCPT